MHQNPTEWRFIKEPHRTTAAKKKKEMNRHPSFLNMVEEDRGEPSSGSSSSSDSSVEPYQTPSFHPINNQAPPPVWANTVQPALPPSPIQTTNSFDRGYANSPLPIRNPFDSFGFEGFPDRPEDTKQFGGAPSPPHPPSALAGAFHPANAFHPFHQPPYEDQQQQQQHHPPVEPPNHPTNPFVSHYHHHHMVYRFEPHYLPSTWHAMYKPTEATTMIDRKPAPPAVPNYSNRPAISPVKHPGALPALFSSSPPTVASLLSPEVVPPVASRDPESSFVNNSSTRAAAAGSPPTPALAPPAALARPAHLATRRSKKVRGGRRQPMAPQHRGNLAHETPSEKELEDAVTNRAKKAIHSWYERFNELVDYANKFGDTAVPQQYQDNHALGIWVNKQRMEMKAHGEKNKTSMTPRRMELLKKINFEWAKPKGVAAWDEKFEELKEYKEQHGDCHVPTKHKGNRPLGRWVSTQRNMKKNYERGITPKSLTDDELHRRIGLLEGIGFAWSMVDSPTNSNDGSQS